MKKITVLLLAFLLCPATYAIDLKSYFDSGKGWGAMMDAYFEDFEFPDDEGETERRVTDSCTAVVRSYVFDELGGTMDKNSVQYAELLMKWVRFLDANRYLEENRAYLQQVRKILGTYKKHPKLYMESLVVEADSWNKRGLVPAYSDDTLAIVTPLLNQAIDISRLIYRPVDKEYLDAVKLLSDFTYREPWYGQPVPDEGYTEDFFDYMIFDRIINFYSFLWQDLEKWTNITADEYYALCDTSILKYENPIAEYGERSLIYFHDRQGIDGSDWTYWQARFGLDKMFEADWRIIQRVDPNNGAAYLAAAERYLNALFERNSCDSTGVTEQTMLDVHTCCQQVLKSKHLKPSDEKYYQFALNDVYALMTLGDRKKEVNKMLTQLYKQARKQDYILEMIRILQTQAEEALLEEDYDRAMTLYEKATPLIQQLDEPGKEEIEMADNILNVGRVAVLVGDFKKAFASVDEFFEVLGWYPEEYVSDHFGFLEQFGFRKSPNQPYLRKLQDLYEQRLGIEKER